MLKFCSNINTLHIPDYEPEEEAKASIAPEVLGKANLLGTSDKALYPGLACSGSAIFVPTQECDSCDHFIELLNGKQDLLTAGTGITIVGNIISSSAATEFATEQEIEDILYEV